MLSSLQALPYVVCIRDNLQKQFIQFDLDKKGIVEMVNTGYFNIPYSDTVLTRFFINNESLPNLQKALQVSPKKKMMVVLPLLFSVPCGYLNDDFMKEENKNTLAIKIPTDKVGQSHAACSTKAEINDFYLRAEESASTLIFDLDELKKCKSRRLGDFVTALNQCIQVSVVSLFHLDESKESAKNKIHSLIKACHEHAIKNEKNSDTQDEKSAVHEINPGREQQPPSHELSMNSPQTIVPQRTAVSSLFFPELTANNKDAQVEKASLSIEKPKL